MIEAIVTAVLFVCFYVFGLFAAREVAEPWKKRKFDERQVAEQGRAYKWAFYTVLAYLALWLALSGAGIAPWDTGVGIFLGAALGIGVFAGACILRDAYFMRGGFGIGRVVYINAFGLMMLSFGIRSLRSGEIVKDGVVAGVGAIDLIITALCLALDGFLLVRKLLDRRAEK